MSNIVNEDEWDEDHALDLVLGSMLSEFTEAEIESFLSQPEPNPNPKK